MPGWVRNRAASALLVPALLVPGLILGWTASATASSEPVPIRPALLADLEDTIEDAIARDHIPGAVVMVGQDDRILYAGALGNLAVSPRPQTMTRSTIFDLASLTKVVATTTAIMQLTETGTLDLDLPVARYWPAFAANGKEAITPRQLLTHFSGLPPDLDTEDHWTGKAAALDRIVNLRPRHPPGEAFAYSDINFEILGELVARIAKTPLDVYCRKHIFAPLGMTDTGFRPIAAKRPRIAPTDMDRDRPRRGTVQDPTAIRMGGVAGHAGLFGTAADLARFARMILNGGVLDGHRILSARSVALMTAPQTPPDQPVIRGLGWDIHSPYTPMSDQDLAPGSFGHTGFTGTSLWIDPTSRSYVIILASRLHPDGKGTVKPLRARVAALVAAAIQHSAHPVLTGLDVLEQQNFAPLQGLRVGIITNQTGRDRMGRGTLDILSHAPGVSVKAVFSPEHGLAGTAETKVLSGVEPTTGLPLYSLYGDTKRPTDAMLDGLDALVFDIQDAGVRFYTYAATMGYALEAAARRHIAVYVLDRPDPLDARSVQGPLLDDDLRSFTGYFPMPVRHGMTMGELAQMFNAENRIGADLHVVAMRGYWRDAWYDQTGLAWIPPSPNLRTLEQALLYPGVAMVEGAGVSVGRGTSMPFQVVGAPWIDGGKLAKDLAARPIPGVRFKAVTFTPGKDLFAHRRCRGVRIIPTSRQHLDSPMLGLHLIAALHSLYPERFPIDRTLGMVGSRAVVAALKDGADPQALAQSWQGDMDSFLAVRDRYLLY
jgi:uncharacterized protein YbbC (DUF1343 family)